MNASFIGGDASIHPNLRINTHVLSVGIHEHARLALCPDDAASPCVSFAMKKLLSNSISFVLKHGFALGIINDFATDKWGQVLPTQAYILNTLLFRMYTLLMLCLLKVYLGFY